jgi:predicted HTH transcriptional regulator
MNHKELLELISEGESSTLEFKRKVASSQKIAKEISAFANTKGGHLIVGVDDDGTIYGIHSEKSTIDEIEKACTFFIEPAVTPQIDIMNLYGQDVAVVHIAESEIKPHKILIHDKETNKDFYRAYIRMGEKSVSASKEMTRLMQSRSSDKPLKLSIGDKEKRLFNYLEKKETATVKDFSKLVNISERRAERLMIRLVRAGVLQIHNDLRRDYFTLL